LGLGAIKISFVMKSELLFTCVPAIGTTGCLKMKRLLSTAAVLLAIALCAPCLHAQDIPNPTTIGRVNAYYSSQTVSDVTGPAADLLNGQTIRLPVWNIDGSVSTKQVSQEYLQITYDGVVDASANLTGAKPSASASEISEKYNVPIMVPVKGTAKDKRYAVSINPALLEAAKSVSKAGSANQGILKTYPIPNTNIVYTAPEDQWVNSDPMDGLFVLHHFEWNGLLTDKKLSLSRLNFNYTLNNTVNNPDINNPVYSDYYMLVSSYDAMMFSPSMVYYDSSVPGQETFTTINPFPVTDVMVVYMPNYTDEYGNVKPANYNMLDASGFQTQAVEPDLFSYPSKLWTEGCGCRDANGIDRECKFITYGTSPSATNPVTGLLVRDSSFGAQDSYQNAGPVTLSMSTEGLKKGSYTRYILWRRGYNAGTEANPDIKSVGYIYNSKLADAFAVVDPNITVDGTTDIKTIDADDAVTVFSNAPHQITFNGAEGFTGGNATLYDLAGKTMCTVKITGAEQTIETSFHGFGIVKLQSGAKTQSQKVVVR